MLYKLSIAATIDSRSLALRRMGFPKLSQSVQSGGVGGASGFF
jgi:hypothetical protein